MKLSVQGQADEVEPFMDELKQHPYIDFHHEEVQEVSQHQVCITCDIDLKPLRRVKIVELLKDGEVIVKMPLIDVVHGEIEEGKIIIAGKSFDIFAG
ncbi:hypothetical protein [Thermoactinomyces mirandus]|uniref:Uncharacterized protein n=1 Tax=Thermoactinomyces mirandus TaxID=2756294 RepID=A0A7W1XSE2_9BACL|nr:hypothetical protein [Thermoactinomyces mirandus]MBA4602200.1 hypothetical protein [Thermoactinomyces mirandus]